MNKCCVHAAMTRLLPRPLRRVVYVLHRRLAPHWHRRTLGRPLAHDLLAHLFVAVVKMRTNISLRLMEQLTGVPRATLARMVDRTMGATGAIALHPPSRVVVVDTTIIRLGRNATADDYTGYKHVRGIKMQAQVSTAGMVVMVDGPYPARWHDKRIFLHAAASGTGIASACLIGDKAYTGLTQYRVGVPEKRSHLAYRKSPRRAEKRNAAIARQRMVVEHAFASIKRNRVFYTGFYYVRQRLAMFFRAACVIHNIELQLRFLASKLEL